MPDPPPTATTPRQQAVADRPVGLARPRLGLAWLAVLALTAAVTAWTTRDALSRYEQLRSGWSWDLAYYNQWFWALTRGDGALSVRPLASYAVEGPSVWKSNYLAPIRFLLLPIYLVAPGPRTLLVVQNVVFWWCLPAAFGLVLAESRSVGLALSAVALVVPTPLLWPLVANDFRELQLALPFALWALQGVRGRSVALTAVGVGGLLACRQEFALMVASMAILPPREPQSIVGRFRWARALLFTGLGWFLVGFLGYLALVVGRAAPGQYLAEFGGPRPPLLEVLWTALGILVLGLGAWSFLMGFAPRAAVLTLPWIWSLASGRWAMRMLETVSWHHVRYAAPTACIVLGAGLIGYARLWSVARRFRSGGWMVAGVWAVATLGTLAAWREVGARLDRAPEPVSAAEAAELWAWFRRVGPDDGVLAHYDVTAPLSSRRLLYSYVLDPNKPPGYPHRLPDAIRWAFPRAGDLQPQILMDQGFERVFAGTAIEVYRR